MTSRSIFQKVCPSCMATVSLDTDMCACGHQFDQDNTDTSLSSEEIRLKAEELYENYLAARAEQAANAITAAQAEFTRDPTNEEKSNRVTSAIHEAQAAQTALAMQSSQIAELKKVLSSVKQPISTAPATRGEKKPPVSASDLVNAEPVQRPLKRKMLATEKPRAPLSGMRRSHQPVVQLKSNPITTPVSIPKGQAPVPAQTAIPNSVFRQAQAAKAEKILRAANKTKPDPTNVQKNAPGSIPEPKVTVQVFAATKIAPRLYVLENKKECPNCTASVDSKITRCRCGYEFSSSEQLIPPLSLSEEDRAEFSKLFR